MVRIQELPSGQLIITLPKKLAEFKGWKKGMTIAFREHGPNSFILELRGDEQTK